MDEQTRKGMMLQPDTLLQNRYRVESLIAQGGMGAVYKAIDLRFSSPVALKQNHSSTPETDRAFERESKLLFGLRHAALPRVTDYFTEAGGQFLVMEYIPGDDLHELLTKQNHPFVLEEVLQWADQILDALAYLHQQNPPVVHRDIKPHNLKLTQHGQMVLLDFGIAKGGLAQQTQHMQGGSMRFFTPEYAPIEQVQGSGTEPRSDLYALGATLYHLLTGQPPADALSRASDLAINNQDPQRPAHTVNPIIPVAVSNVLMHAMALNVNQRPASAAAMRTAMQEAGKQARTDASFHSAQTIRVSGRNEAVPPHPSFHDAPTIKVPGQQQAAPQPAPRPPQQPHQQSIPTQQPAAPAPSSTQQAARGAGWLGPALGGAAAVIVFIIIMILIGSMFKPEEQDDMAIAPTTPVATETLEPSPDVAPTLEPTLVPEPSPTLEPTPIPEPTLVPEPSPMPNTLPSGPINPDTVNQIMPLATWENHWDRVTSIAFSPNHELIASASDDNTILIQGVYDASPRLKLEGHTDSVTSVDYSANGQIIASGSEDDSVRLWQASDGTPLAHMQHEDDVLSVAFSPDGQFLATGSADDTVRIWWASNGDALNVLTGIPGSVTAVAFSPDSSMLAFGCDDKYVRLWRVGSEAEYEVLEGHGDDVLSVAFSPDGQVLATGGKDNQIRLWQTGSGTPLNVLRGHTSGVLAVAFSPDGRMLASGANDGTMRLWRVQDGMLLRTIEEHNNDVSSVAFSGDGQTLASASDDRTVRLWSVP